MQRTPSEPGWYNLAGYPPLVLCPALLGQILGWTAALLLGRAVAGLEETKSSIKRLRKCRLLS